jgi:hypothetical protein
MKQLKKYRYIGRNGIITSSVLLDGISHIDMLRIEAEPGFILTNGSVLAYAITIEVEELPQWYEIVDNTRKNN